jgi:hypothetical protein
MLMKTHTWIPKTLLRKIFAQIKTCLMRVIAELKLLKV